MAKGYWVVSVDVSDPEGHKLYIAENRNAFPMALGSSHAAVSRARRWNSRPLERRRCAAAAE